MDVSRETLTSIFGALTDQAIEYGQILASTAVERGLIGPREVDRRRLPRCFQLYEERHTNPASR